MFEVLGILGLLIKVYFIILVLISIRHITITGFVKDEIKRRRIRKEQAEFEERYPKIFKRNK